MTLPLPPQHIKSKSTWDPNLNPNPTIYIYNLYIHHPDKRNLGTCYSTRLILDPAPQASQQI